MDGKAFCLFSEHSAVTSLRSADGVELLAANANETNAVAESKAAKRSELLKSLREGEHVEVEFDARVFFQLAGLPNRNFTRFKNSILNKLARSFVGMPFLRDHEQHNMNAVAGKILKSKLEPATGKLEGGQFITQTILVAAPWAVELALTGLIDKFSIGWFPTGPINCTACKASFRDCGHWPGDVLEDETVVEAEFQSADGIETSAVPIPAVPQVGIDEVRAALALATARNPNKVGDQMDIATLAKALGVPEGTELADFVNGLKAERDGLQVKLDAEQAAHLQTKTALETATALLADVEATALVVAVDLMIDKLYEDGKLAPVLGTDGKRIESDPEKQLRAYAKQFGAKAAAEFCAPWPVVTQAGRTSVALAHTPPRAEPGPQLKATFGPIVQSAMDQLDLTEEQVLSANPHLRNKALA